MFDLGKHRAAAGLGGMRRQNQVNRKALKQFVHLLLRDPLFLKDLNRFANQFTDGFGILLVFALLQRAARVDFLGQRIRRMTKSDGQGQYQRPRFCSEKLETFWSCTAAADASLRAELHLQTDIFLRPSKISQANCEVRNDFYRASRRADEWFERSIRNLHTKIFQSI